MQNAVLLQHDANQLCMENKYQRQGQTAIMVFIRAAGILTGTQVLQKAQEQEAIVEDAHQPVSRLCRPPTCSIFGKTGRIWLNYPKKYSTVFVDNMYRFFWGERLQNQRIVLFGGRRQPGSQLSDRLCQGATVYCHGQHDQGHSLRYILIRL